MTWYMTFKSWMRRGRFERPVVYEIVTTDGGVLAQFEDRNQAVLELLEYVETNRARDRDLGERLALIAIDPRSHNRVAWTPYSELAPSMVG